MKSDLLYRLALNKVHGIGPVSAKSLYDHFGDAAAIFRATPETLSGIHGIGPKAIRSILEFNDYSSVEKECCFLEKHKIRTLFFTDKEYPQRLLQYKNAPPLLFYKGNADLNAAKIISVIGTRIPTDYGKMIADTFIKDLAATGILIVSGLAYGIDAAAHRAAVQYQLPTLGVLGHDLTRIYPSENTQLAKQMVKNGGLLTSFSFGTGPDDRHFPLRNQIVAAICDALIVIETGTRGGSLLTVSNAAKYGKKIFAFPGRIDDPRSEGCNALIAAGTAGLLTNAKQFLSTMDWDAGTTLTRPVQPDLFSVAADSESLSSEEKIILLRFRQKKEIFLEELLNTPVPGTDKAAASLLNLELRGFIRSLPGKRYRLAI